MMPGTMAEKKRKRGRPKGRQKTVVVQARVPVSVHAALEQLAQKNRRTKNAEMILALEEHLRQAGLLAETSKAEAPQPDQPSEDNPSK